MLNILLDDNNCRNWLIEVITELELMYNEFTFLAEVADEITNKQLGLLINRTYDGGITQAVLDYLPC